MRPSNPVAGVPVGHPTQLHPCDPAYDERRRRASEIGFERRPGDSYIHWTYRHPYRGRLPEEETFMAWTKPIIREIECGMEINMYGPDGDEDPVLF